MTDGYDFDYPQEQQPPHNHDAEQSVLGILLTDNRKFDDVHEILDYSHFYDFAHGAIYKAISELVTSGCHADIITVAETLGDEMLAKIGGLPYLVELGNSFPSVSGLKKYVTIVSEKYKLRKLAGLFNDNSRSCFSDNPPLSSEISEIVAKEIDELSLNNAQNEPESLASVFIDAIQYIGSRCENNSLKTLFSELDEKTGGFEDGDLIVLAARPSMGKTAFAINIADNVAKNDKSVLVFSLEMSTKQLGLRILSSRTKIPMYALRGGAMSESDCNLYSYATRNAGKEKLFIDDKPSVRAAYIRIRARQIKRKHGLDLIIIDYLQLMRGTGDNRTQEIGSITRELKAIAKEMEVPIIVLAQLNRGLESRGDKRPVLSDLRDSGEIEQDADIVLMLHREEVYKPELTDYHGLAECLIRKQRNGGLGEIWLNFQGEIMTFTDYHGVVPNPNVVYSSTKNDRGFK